ncbi:MAG: T9SS type A sorting domain-containing protein, partial [Hymenobacter sp.]
NAYTITTTSVTHLYRDITVPAGQSTIQLSFDWKAGGESTYDYLLVQVAPTTFTPVAGTLPATTSVTVLAQINLQAAYRRTTIQLPPSLAGSTQRLIFTWRNDNSGGVQPPVALDNVLLTAQTPSPLNGAYTINNAAPTGGTNFARFSEAADALNLNGVSGPVTIAVTGGPYTEQFLLGQVAGTSATNTLVVNGGGSTIRFASTNSAQRAVVQLNGTDYTTISNLTIDATGGTGASATYGYGVLLTNAADNDRIANNTINADITTTSSGFAGIVVSGSATIAASSGTSASRVLIEGNTVNGGYYGITLYGAGTTSLNMGNIVRNNIVRDFYYYGISSAYQDGAQLIGNDVSRPLRTNGSSFSGIESFGSSINLAIEKNRIHDTFAGNPASSNLVYGISLSNGAVSASNYVLNNVFYNLSGNGTQYAIYNSGSALTRIYNNTITSDDQASTSTYTTYGIYNTGATVDVANNVVSITRAGTGTKYGLYYSTATTTSNYNDIYVPSGNVGYYTTAFTTLANWQTANSNAFDANSLSVDPVFVGAPTGNLLPSNVLLNNAGTPLARVTDDITGAVRGAIPDLGAYEFTPVAIDVAPVSLLGPATGTACFSGAEPLIVQIRNNGTAALDFAANVATVTAVVTPPTGAAQTFTATVSTGTLASGATQNVTLSGTLNMTALGTYSFAVTATVVGDANVSNNLLVPTPTRTVVAPAAGVLSSAIPICLSGTATLVLAGSANGSIQYQSSTSATGTFTDIAGATAASFTTPALTTTTYYRVRTTCNATTVYSNVTTVTVNNPLVATVTTPLTICAGNTATLTATTSAGSTARFYTAATGGTALTSNVTPVLTASTTYYAAAVVGNQENVGATAYTSTGQTPQVGGAMYFTTTGPTFIANVTVYLNAGQAAGTVTIDLRTGSSTTGAVVNGQSMAFAVPASPATGITPYVIPLNYTVPAAGQYTLYLSTATQGGLLRDSGGANSTGYPYASPSGGLTITGPSVTGYYYYFYNWQLGSECVSATRTPIQVNVTAVVTPTLTAAAQPNGAVLLTASAVAGATYQFFRNGVAVAAASTANTLLLQSGTFNGSYTVVVTNAGCTSAPSAAVAVVVTGTRTATLNGVSLHVYPNPTPDGSLTLELNGPQAKASQLTVLNSLGQVVHSRTLPAGTAQLSLAHLAAGMYTLQVQTSEGMLTQRVVRE